MRTDSELKEAIFGGRFSSQVLVESYALCKFLTQRPLEKMLEIGAGLGSTPIFEFLLEEHGLLVSVDINIGPIESVRTVVNQDLVKLIQADSLKPETVDKIREYFDDETVDFLFIDGEHAYSHVNSDYRIYRQFVKPGGVIALHDCMMDGPGRVFQEAGEQGLTTEMVGDVLGIGVILKEG